MGAYICAVLLAHVVYGSYAASSDFVSDKLLFRLAETRACLFRGQDGAPICADYKVIIGRPGEPGITQDRLLKTYALRAEVFNGRNRWGLPAADGLERDAFDSDSSVYVLCLEVARGAVIGCWRIRPTTSSTMLNTIFSDLLPRAQAIQNPNIWELSRFAIKKGFVKTSPMLAGRITRDMFGCIRAFAFRMEVAHFVTVVSPSLYRLLGNRLTMPRIDNKSDAERRRLGRTACYLEIDANLDSFIDGVQGYTTLQDSV